MYEENRKREEGGQEKSVASVVTSLEIVTGLERRPSTVSHTIH